MSEMRQFFVDAVERLFEVHCPIDVVEAAERGLFPSKLWAALVDIGVPVMLVPEEQGGIGISIGDAAAVLAVIGKAAVPGPLIETIVANYLLALAGMEVGPEPVALAVQHRPDCPIDIHWPHHTARCLVVRPAGNGVQIKIGQPGDIVLRSGDDTVGETRGRFQSLSNQQILEMEDVEFEWVMNVLSILNAARCGGALGWILERTSAYAKERVQFGREIGKFQAVQQNMAALAGSIAATREAICAAAEWPDRLLLNAAARSQLGDTIDVATRISHQVHGAIGFSREYPLNYRTRRLMAWRDVYGTTQYWRVLLGSSMIRAGANIWSAITLLDHPVTLDKPKPRKVEIREAAG